MAGDPHAVVAMPFPAADDPDCARMRTRRPAASNPNPMIVPFIRAGNPKPNRDGTGRDGHDFILRRRRRRFVRDNFTGWLGGGLVAINGLAFRAAGKQRQAGGD